jgi:hypothetical protein
VLIISYLLYAEFSEKFHFLPYLYVIMRKTATILFHARQQAHFWHLDTKSHSEHVSLEKFYVEVLELIDKLLEIYLGKGKRIDFGNVRMTFHGYNRDKMIEYFKRLARYLTRAKKSLRESDGDLANVMDDILGTINRTLFLLTLK